MQNHLKYKKLGVAVIPYKYLLSLDEAYEVPEPIGKGCKHLEWF